MSNEMIFIIGAPRSGTKLLRGLLNNHSQVYIPEAETLFLFKLYQQWEDFGDLSIKTNFYKLHKYILATPFYSYLIDLKEETIVDVDLWFDKCSSNDYGHVMSNFFRVCAIKKSKIIFGDKTPSYLYPIDFIRTQFPGAKILHIVRDPRDYVLSVKKAWNKNIFRSADKWNYWINTFCKSLAEKNDNLLVKYEDLLTNSESELIRICDFLSIKFEKSMLSVSNQVENLGDAKGKNRIINDNFGKWKNKLNTEDIALIEGICFDSMVSMGYPPLYSTNKIVIPKFKKRFYHFLDIYNLFNSSFNRDGLKGVIRQFKLLSLSK